MVAHCTRAKIDRPATHLLRARPTCTQIPLENSAPVKFYIAIIFILRNSLNFCHLFTRSSPDSEVACPRIDSSVLALRSTNPGAMKCIVFSLLAAVAVSIASASPIAWQHVPSVSFEQFVRIFRKTYASAELPARQAQFEQRKAEIVAHNARGEPWKRTLVPSSDALPGERAYPAGVHKPALHAAVQLDSRVLHQVPAGADRGLPASVDWSEYMFVRDQGHCGSCYAHGSTSTLAARLGMAGFGVPTLSVQQAMDCTSNPQDCGGVGGCGGGTAETVFDSITKAGGIASEWTYYYNNYHGNIPTQTCKFNSSKGATPPVATLAGYVAVPSNNYTAVMHALSQGPLVINVDASKWSDYAGGVYAGCNAGSSDIDHVVVLAGYGTDPVHGPYWLVMNSWGVGYGEKGFIRIARSSTPMCTTDKTPSDGTGCNNGPSEVTVCGECGILYDALYPVATKLV